MNPARVGELLRSIVGERGLTDATLAEMSGLKRSTVNRMQAGAQLTLENLDAVVQALGLSASQFFARVEGTSPSSVRDEVKAAVREVFAEIEEARREVEALGLERLKKKQEEGSVTAGRRPW